VESYRTEDEQVEALKRWWQENGRSTMTAIVLALGVGFGWQGWKNHQEDSAQAASSKYQELITMVSAVDGEPEEQDVVNLAEEIKAEYTGSTYAQFASFQLAAIAVKNEDLVEAESQLRWVLSQADKGGDVSRVAQLRLARVVGSRGDTEQALAILAEGAGDSYQASYALARGDILLAAGRPEEARQAYATAQALASLSGRELATLQAKLQSLSPVPPMYAEIASDVELESDAELIDLFSDEQVAPEDLDGDAP
jgi:predicted negative regulator of RcsB-dependent stress response